MPKFVIPGQQRRAGARHHRSRDRGMTPARPVTRSALLVALALATSSAVVDADTHRFVPERFYNTFSFAHPPALRIKPGDRVVTKTIDAGGVDWNGKPAPADPIRRPGRSSSKAPSPGTCWW